MHVGNCVISATRVKVRWRIKFVPDLTLIFLCDFPEREVSQGRKCRATGELTIMHSFAFHIHLSVVCILVNKNISLGFYLLFNACYISRLAVYTLVPSAVSTAWKQVIKYNWYQSNASLHKVQYIRRVCRYASLNDGDTFWQMRR